MAIEGAAIGVDVMNGSVDVEVVGSLFTGCDGGELVVAVDTISCGFACSTLDRDGADASWGLTGDNDLSGFDSAVLFLPQKERSPLFLFLSLTASVSACTFASLLFSTIRQPTGKSSCTTSRRDLTDVSHAVEPFDATS